MIQKKYFASILFVLISFVCFAQGSGPPPPQAPPPVGVPIDGGIYVLLFLGLIYGAYRAIKLQSLKS